MKLEKKEAKNKNATAKITESQLNKLDKLAEKHNITRSSLVSQLLELGYKEFTKNKVF